MTDEDFIGSHYEVEYLLHKEKLGTGNQFGKIVVKSLIRSWFTELQHPAVLRYS